MPFHLGVTNRHTDMTFICIDNAHYFLSITLIKINDYLLIFGKLSSSKNFKCYQTQISYLSMSRHMYICNFALVPQIKHM